LSFNSRIICVQQRGIFNWIDQLDKSPIIVFTLKFRSNPQKTGKSSSIHPFSFATSSSLQKASYMSSLGNLNRDFKIIEENFLEICKEFGGYCDCEILMNAAPILLDEDF